MAETIYLVETGYYSDRYISAVFRNRDLADAYARSQGESSVIEVDIEETIPEKAKRYLRPGEHAYDVVMDVDGNQAQASERWTDPAETFRVRVDKGRPTRLRGETWAMSEEHAIKIMNERRTLWMILGKPLPTRISDYGWGEVNLAEGMKVG